MIIKVGRKFFRFFAASGRWVVECFDMDITLILIIILGSLVITVIFLNKKLTDLKEAQKPSEELLEVIKMLQTGSKEDRKVLLDSLQRNTQALNERLDSAARVIAAVQKNIGEFTEIGRGMKDLQEFLRSPKLRGNVGEQVLKELLLQFLPKQSFHLQYTFKSGDKVDAAIKTAAGIIPVDSKFPMENFRRMMEMNGDPDSPSLRAARKNFESDVKKHIESISKKYILTEEGTIDYALMYIPSESVYYEVVNSPSLFDYAQSRRVLPVSPTTFYAYLRAILMSFEGQKIEAKAREILVALRAIQKDYSKVNDNLNILQRHLTNASNMMTTVLTSFSHLGQKILSTQNLGGGVKKEVKELEK